jgi:hypothetical protein
MSMLQRLIAELLRPTLARFLAERGERAFVGDDHFIYWVEGDSSQRVAPDVYVIFGEDPDALPRSWLLWQCEHRPSFALEVVGRDVEKDYEDAPNEYKAMEIDELIAFDPEAIPGHPRRVRWQKWRRVKKRGFVPVFRGDGDRVYSETLRCWIRLVGEGARGYASASAPTVTNSSSPIESAKTKRGKRKSARRTRARAIARSAAPSRRVMG